HHGATGGLVAAAGLHAHIAVLDDIGTTDTVFASDSVQGGQHGGGRHFLAVDGDDVALLVLELDVGRLVRCILRGHGPQPHILFGLGARVLEQVALIGDVQQVGIHRIGRLGSSLLLYGDVVLLAVGHQCVAGGQVPFAPGGDHLDARLERIGAELETDLVVALAGGAMGNGVGAGLVGDLDQALGNQRTGNGCAQ